MDPLVARLQGARDSIRPCDPVRWAPTGHFQTILGHLLPSPPLTHPLIGHQIELGGGEKIHSNYVPGTKKLVLYLFHGLGGSAEAMYMQRTAQIAHELGYHVYLNNHRGCGEGIGLASEPYHSGRGEDLGRVITFGRSRHPESFHVAIGFSLSANALLLLCTGARGDCPPDAAIAVNGPINLDRASRALQRGLSWVYNLRFVHELKRHVKANHPEEFWRLKQVRDLRSFDAVYTGPIGGFGTRENYYRICSAGQYLKDLKLPTVLLSAEDDPFVLPEDYQAATIGPLGVLHLEKHGGHMGYLSRSKGRWLDYALGTYLRTIAEGLMVT